jgi:hypothetical protein
MAERAAKMGSRAARLGPRVHARAVTLALGFGLLLVLAGPAASQDAGAAGGTPTHAQVDQRRTRSYLAEMAMVLEGARRLLLWSENYVGDPEFARFAHPIAERYVDMAGRLVPPAHLINAHPHMLLVTENVERALDAAGSGDTPTFRQRARIVREELVTLESVLKQLKLRLPELAR